MAQIPRIGSFGLLLIGLGVVWVASQFDRGQSLDGSGDAAKFAGGKLEPASSDTAESEGGQTGDSSADASACPTGTHYVTASALNVRARPVDGPVVARLQKRDRVEVLECQDQWARIASSQWVHIDYLSKSQSSARTADGSFEKAARFRRLRNDAIRMLGRIAGNSYEHPIWPEVKPYVARGGQYYDFFLRLAPPGLSRSEQEAEAFANVRLYQEWFEKGRAQPFNESDNINKIRRIQQIATEVIAVYK